jgi:hypothetical protein
MGLIMKIVLIILCLVYSAFSYNLGWPQCSGIIPTAIATSSVESGTSLTANNMVDGILSQGVDRYGNELNRWNSDYNSTQTVNLIFPNLNTMNELYIYWDKNFATQGSIQYSTDGISWALIQNFSNTKSGIQIINFNKLIYAKYIRLNLTQGTLINSKFWGYSIREIQVNSTTCNSNTSSQYNLSSANVVSSNSNQSKLAKQLLIPIPTQNSISSDRT